MRESIVVALLILSACAQQEGVGSAPTRQLPTPSPMDWAEQRVMWSAQSTVSNLLYCRENRARDACAPVMLARDTRRVPTEEQVAVCNAAKKAVLGDGIFDRLKAVRDDRNKQFVIAADALDECQRNSGGVRSGADIAAALDMPLKK